MSARSMSDLYAAARGDAPSDLVKGEVWEKVAAQVALPAATVGAGAVVKSAIPLTTKVVAALAILSAATAAALALTFVDDAPRSSASAPHRVRNAVDHGPNAGARLGDVPPRGRAERSVTTSIVGPLASAETAPSVPASDSTSSLAAEARLVTEARAALVRGEADQAIALVQQTHAFPVRALEPEELTIELRAQRMMGHADEALATELTLRQRFPDHSLTH
jgi:hypothetical protein